MIPKISRFFITDNSFCGLGLVFLAPSCTSAVPLKKNKKKKNIVEEFSSLAETEITVRMAPDAQQHQD